MLDFSRRDRPADPKDAAKPPLKPALYDPSGAAGRAAAANVPPRPSAPTVTPPRDAAPPAVLPSLTTREPAIPTLSPSPETAAASPRTSAAPGESRLSVGINIKLKGVEISDCDVLLIEGHMDATVHSKVMEIARPGTLKGTALIDVAEIHGEFSGELTARTRLIVHGTGRVSGTIRYGKLVVAEGGELSGDVKRLEEGGERA